jgi:spore germination protein
VVIYVVKRGDSIYSISKKYGVNSARIIMDNQLQTPNKLVIGQALVIMTNNTLHTVTQGQSLYSIALLYGTTVDRLIAANPSITNPSNIPVGTVINIPIPSSTPRTIEVNGYAFPNINPSNLNRALPYLTYVSIFSYQIRPDGSLIPIPDSNIINTARNAAVMPMMVITNIKEGASFDSDLAHTILTDMTVQNTLIDNTIKILNEKRYYGLDIDIEYIYPEDREAYNNFLRKITARLHALGYIVTTAVAPKTSATQSGLLYEAHDYKAHGEIVDHVIIMTYEWGYTYGPAQAVAPIDQVEKVLQYAVTAIPSAKIFLGMPNYGYDWTLPFVSGSAARSISNVEAINIAVRHNSQIQYDTKSQAPFFNYTDNAGKRHEVWFDDARSIQARLQLIDKYKLGGVSYWTINTFFSQNWLVLQSLYNVKKL